jgi:N-acetylglucosaminyldiphosphoundecaprenol N-acetyl-beta-D-mannosaminyltransferase
MATEIIAVDGPMLRPRDIGVVDFETRRPARRPRVAVSDVLIDQVDRAMAVQKLNEFLTSPGLHQIVTVNLDFLSIAHREVRFREIINNADLAVADGMPLVWVSRIKDQPLPQRITGVELVHECCLIAARDHRSIYLLGAAPGIAEAAASQLIEQYPGLRIAGAYSPPYRTLTEAEDVELIRTINATNPDILLVALGAPRQDRWIYEHRARLTASIAIGVGCVLDLYAGVVSRAPGWMQRTGLEWSYRLVQEPGRLWRRYILDDIPMLGRLVLNGQSTSTHPRLMHIRPAEGQAQ